MSETNVIEYLNSILANKPGVRKTGSRRVAKTVCRTIGPSKDRYDVCSTTYVDESYEYVEPARATTSRVLKISDLVVKTTQATTLPESALLTRKVIRNHADVSVASSISLSVSGTQSWNVTKTQGVNTTYGGSCTLSVAIPKVGTGNIGINWSQTVTTSTAIAEGESRSITRTSTDTVSIGPRRSVSVELLAYQSAVEIPFKAVIVVDGDLEPNNNGVSQASQVLTEAERTIEFSGVIRISDVSDSFLTTNDLGPVDSPQDSDVTVESEQYDTVALPSLQSSYANRFLRPVEIYREKETFAIGTIQAQVTESGGAAIGPPDGTHYEVLYVTQSYKATPLCGFNDLGIMNTGLFSVEARQYTTYDNGVPIAQWSQLVESFSSCFLP